MNCVKIPVDLLTADLSAKTKALWAGLAALCRDGEERLLATQSEVATQLHISRPTLRKYLGVLTASEWLSMEKAAGRKTLFVLRNPNLEREQQDLLAVQRRLDRSEYKGEAIMREWLTLIVDSNDYDDQARPGFLRNPLTGETMEYDRWYTSGVAFEFNGPQHYGPTDRYPDPDQARRTVGRDYIKKAISQEQGIHLVTITPADLSLDGMRKKVGGLLPLREVSREHPVARYLTTVSAAYRRKAKTARWRSPA